MPKCAVCYDMFPPQFMIEIEGSDKKKCLYCDKGKDSLELNEKDGSTTQYSKADCKRDYIAFVNELKQRVSNKEAVKKLMKGD